MPPMTKANSSSVAQTSLHRRERLRPRRARAGGQKARPRVADDRDGDHVHADGENARQHAGDEQLADVLLGDQAVDRKHRRRRDHDAERAAGRDDAGRERLRIVEAPHFRIGDSWRTSPRSRPTSRRSPQSRRRRRWWRCRGRRADDRGRRCRRGTVRGSCRRSWRTRPSAETSARRRN